VVCSSRELTSILNNKKNEYAEEASRKMKVGMKPGLKNICWVTSVLLIAVVVVEYNALLDWQLLSMSESYLEFDRL
jgi:hypothetical protein